MKLRYERKYLVPYHLMSALRSRISGFVREDIFAKTNGKGLPEYTVRSIYFDSPDLVNYHEKQEGLKHRRKLRVRSYNSYSPDKEVVLEMKRKLENRIRKYRSSLAYHHLEDMLASGELEKYLISGQDPTRDLEDGRRFFFHYKMKPFFPTTLVTYEREAYHGKLNPGTRITFDKNIRSRNYPALDELFSEENMRFLFKSHFIMEIKYFEDHMPAWVKGIVHEFRLRHEALSKYTIGYDVNRSYVHY